MDARELAQALRHIAEELGGGGDATEAVDALHELAEELDPGGLEALMAYVEGAPDGSDGDTGDP